MKDDIIRMAREARLTDPDLGDWVTDYGGAEDAIMKFAALVAAAEREAILQMSAATWFATQTDYDAAIRARGQDSMPLFGDWPQFACPPCNQRCEQGRLCPNKK